MFRRVDMPTSLVLKHCPAARREIGPVSGSEWPILAEWLSKRQCSRSVEMVTTTLAAFPSALTAFGGEHRVLHR
jgi:hypothetical protein